MKKYTVPAAVILLVVSAFAHLSALEIGDKAPALQISQWIQKGPVDVTDGKNVYLLEFFATWCNPCLKSIPHLIEIQKKYQSRGVRVLGVSTESADTVKNFLVNLRNQGTNVDYTVGVDDNQKSFGEYMGARAGIPHIFIIDKKGIIAWSGSPYDADDILPKVLSGNYDIKSLKYEKSKKAQIQMILQTMSPANSTEKIMKDIIALLKITPDDQRIMDMFAYFISSKNLEVLPYLKTLSEKVPENSMVQLYLLKSYIINNLPYDKQAEKILEQFKNNKKVLALMADNIMNNVPFGELDGKLLIRIIDNITKEPFSGNNQEKADMLALKVQALYMLGKIDQALKEQETVVSLKPSDRNKKILKFLKFLKSYGEK